jgi:hypothetical protein
MGLEAYYRARVISRVDTSATRLLARWQKEPRRYDGQPSWIYHGTWYLSREAADSARMALEAGARWDSLLAARFPLPSDPEVARATHWEGEDFREPQALLADGPDSTLRAWFTNAPAGKVFGPRERAGQFWVYRLLRHEDGKRTTFAEARPYVLEAYLREASERELRHHFQELRARYPVRVNERALAGAAALVAKEGSARP